MSIVHIFLLAAIVILLGINMMLRETYYSRKPWLRPGDIDSTVRSGVLFFFWHNDKLINLGQVVWLNRATHEVRLSSGDLITMTAADFDDFVSWINCPPDIKIPQRVWGLGGAA